MQRVSIFIAVIAICISIKSCMIANDALELNKMGYRPIPQIKPYSVRYLGQTMFFDYYIFNAGKSRILDIKRCHSLSKANKFQENKFMEVKYESCISNEYDKSIDPEDASLIHNDEIGNYKILEDGEYFRLDLSIEYKEEEFFKRTCKSARSFYLRPFIETKTLAIQPLAPTPPICK